MLPQANTPPAPDRLAAAVGPCQPNGSNASQLMCRHGVGCAAGLQGVWPRSLAPGPPTLIWELLQARQPAATHTAPIAQPWLAPAPRAKAAGLRWAEPWRRSQCSALPLQWQRDAGGT